MTSIESELINSEDKIKALFNAITWEILDKSYKGEFIVKVSMTDKLKRKFSQEKEFNPQEIENQFLIPHKNNSHKKVDNKR